VDNPRRVLITGVGRGLGRAMVSQFIALGHTVIGCSRSEQSIQELAQDHEWPHRFDCVDIANAAEVEKWALSVLEEEGPADLLLNNAATINGNATLWQVPVNEFSKVIDVNIKGTYHVLRYFLPAMVAREQGVIVNFSSGWGRSAAPEVAPYCATKWAIEGLTMALAQELPHGMAAVALNPGIINTDMLQSCFGADASAYPGPEQWASRSVPFLLSLDASDNGRPQTAPA